MNLNGMKVLLRTMTPYLLVSFYCQRRLQAAFRSIVKYYETKQYKKGLTHRRILCS